MANFISIALGEGTYKHDETEKLKLKVPESTTSIPVELIKKIDSAESEYYEQLKIKEQQEGEQFFQLPAKIMSFDEYDNVSSKEVGVHEIERLRLVDSQSEGNTTSSPKVELLETLKSMTSGVAGVETLPKNAITSLESFVDSLENSRVSLQMPKSSEDITLSLGSGLPGGFLDEMKLKLEEFKDESYISQEQYEQIKTKLQLIRDNTPEVRDLDGKSPDETDGIELRDLKVQSEGEDEVKVTLDNKVDSESEDPDLKIKKETLNAEAQIPTVPEGENSDLTLAKLVKSGMSESEAMKKVAEDRYQKVSLSKSDFQDMPSAGKYEYISDGTWEFEPLTGGLLAEMAKSLNINPMIAEKYRAASSTLAKRFALNDLISDKTGLTYSDYSTALEYHEIAKRILAASDGKGIVEISAENLVFAATFAAFLDPLTVEAPTTKDRGLRYGGQYKKGITGMVPTDDAAFAEKARNQEKVNFFHSDAFDKLPFLGRKSVEGIELFNTSHWDIRFDKITVGDISDNGSAVPITKVPLPRYNNQWWVDADEIDEDTWLPVNSFSVNLTNPVYETLDPYGNLPMQIFSGVNYPMSGSLEFMETESLWLRNWMRDYMAACYEDDGVTCKYTYHQMSLKMSIYIWDALENLDTAKKKKLYDRLYSENANSESKDKTDTPDTPQYLNGEYVRKYVFYILPQIQGEQWNGTPGPTLLDKTTLNFSIVGGEGVSLMALDSKYKDRFKELRD